MNKIRIKITPQGVEKKLIWSTMCVMLISNFAPEHAIAIDTGFYCSDHSKAANPESAAIHKALTNSYRFADAVVECSDINRIQINALHGTVLRPHVHAFSEIAQNLSEERQRKLLIVQLNDHSPPVRQTDDTLVFQQPKSLDQLKEIWSELKPFIDRLDYQRVIVLAFRESPAIGTYVFSDTLQNKPLPNK